MDVERIDFLYSIIKKLIEISSVSEKITEEMELIAKNLKKITVEKEEIERLYLDVIREIKAELSREEVSHEKSVRTHLS